MNKGPEQQPNNINTSVEVKAAMRHIAQILTGKKYPPSGKGNRNAIAALEQRRRELLPPMVQEISALTGIVAQEHMAITLAASNVAIGLNNQDYELALSAANHLYFYGEADYQDSLGGRTLELSRQLHRAFMEHAVECFGRQDPYLVGHFDQVLAGIVEARDQGHIHEELDLMRGVIHTVAFNGTLGKAAWQCFDPFALIRKRII